MITVTVQGSDESEYETQLLLSAGQRATLREIDAALQRIEDGTYGVCEATGQPIARPYLSCELTTRAVRPPRRWAAYALV